MDGVHDLGGLAGFGAVEIEADEPTFHADWERRVFRLYLAAARAGFVKSGGAFRHSIERMEPAHYLNSSYYEHWLTGITTLAVEGGLVTGAELDEVAGGRFPLSGVDRGAAPNPDSDDQAVPQFAIGSEVWVRAWHPAGHTRAPRYVQGKQGVVVRRDGAFSVPDVEAHSDQRRREPTYSVRFTTEELWGAGGAPGELVHVDLWESYLEALDAERP